MRLSELRLCRRWPARIHEQLALPLVQPAEQMERYRREGTLGPRAVLLYSFEAATHEEAQAIHSLRMGWGPYRPEGEPKPCPTCGAFYYPEGSGECWRCLSLGLPAV